MKHYSKQILMYATHKKITQSKGSGLSFLSFDTEVISVNPRLRQYEIC